MIFIAEVEEAVVRDGDPLLYYRESYRAIGGPRSGPQDSEGSIGAS